MTIFDSGLSIESFEWSDVMIKKGEEEYDNFSNTSMGNYLLILIIVTK